MTAEQFRSALQAARPGAEWLINYADKNSVQYADLQWLDKTQSKPTQEELGL